jgi:hypothetical protein
MEPQFDTKPLLRPSQLADARNELKSLEARLQSPHIEDKGEVARQLRRVSKTVADQTPIPPTSAEEEGRMVARSRSLLSDILQGMPSQEEMRKAPPGAVDKHMRWERANKQKILEWKNLQLRMTHGEDAEAANLERHRPTGSSLNMDSAFIQGKQFFMPETTSPSVVFSEAQIAFLRNLNPALADMIGTLSNEQRTEVKQAIEGIGLSAPEPSPASIAGLRGAARKREIKAKEAKKQTRTPEERAAWGEKMRLARAAKRLVKE